MPKPSTATYLEMWYAALRSNCGLVIATDDFERLRARLYKAREEALDSELNSLSIVQSPTNEGELWIVHREKKDGA